MNEALTLWPTTPAPLNALERLTLLTMARIGPATDEQIAAACGRYYPTIGRRRTELVRFGLAFGTGRFAPTSRKKDAQLWQLTVAGVERARQEREATP